MIKINFSLKKTLINWLW